MMPHCNNNYATWGFVIVDHATQNIIKYNEAADAYLGISQTVGDNIPNIAAFLPTCRHMKQQPSSTGDESYRWVDHYAWIKSQMFRITSMKIASTLTVCIIPTPGISGRITVGDDGKILRMDDGLASIFGYQSDTEDQCISVQNIFPWLKLPKDLSDGELMNPGRTTLAKSLNLEVFFPVEICLVSNVSEDESSMGTQIEVCIPSQIDGEIWIDGRGCVQKCETFLSDLLFGVSNACGIAITDLFVDGITHLLNKTCMMRSEQFSCGDVASHDRPSEHVPLLGRGDCAANSVAVECLDAAENERYIRHSLGVNLPVVLLQDTQVFQDHQELACMKIRYSNKLVNVTDEDGENPKNFVIPSALAELYLIQEHLPIRGGFKRNCLLLTKRKKHRHHVVFKAIRKTSIPAGASTRDTLVDSLLPTEVFVLTVLWHPGIPSIHDVFESSTHFLMGVKPAGITLTALVSHAVLEETLASYIFRQVSSALAHLHERGVAHRNLVPEHILIGREFEVTIVGFGSARYMSKGDFPVATALNCCPPEVFSPSVANNHLRGSEIDLWLMAISLNYAVSAFLPGIEFLNSPTNYSHHLLQRSTNLSQSLRSLLEGLVEVTPHVRLNMFQARSHPWMRQPVDVVPMWLDYRHLFQQYSTTLSNQGLLEL